MILGWLGNKIYAKLDEMSGTMRAIEGDLHDRINGLDKRVTVIETRCEANHAHNT